MIRRYSRIADIPATDWDRAAAIGGFYATAAWAELYEPLSPTYVVAHDDGDVLAVAPVYVAPHPGVFPAIADEMFPTKDAYPLAIAGPVRGYSTRTCVRSDLAPDRRRHVIAELTAEVRRIAEDAGARTWGFAYVPREDAHELCAIEPALQPIFFQADAWLPVPPSFDDYLAGFDSHRRRAVRADTVGFARAGLRSEPRELAGLEGELAAPIADHEKKYGVQVDAAWMRKRLETFTARFKTRVFRVVGGERAIGGSIFMVHEPGLYARGCGFDEAQCPKKAAVYFNAVFYEPLRWAIDNGITFLHYGTGSLEAKLLRGCHLRSLWWAIAGDPDMLARARTSGLARAETARALAAKHEGRGDMSSAELIAGTTSDDNRP